MKTPARVLGLLHLTRHWVAWPGLVMVLAVSGCKPRELVCRPEAFFQVITPERGTGTEPFSIEQVGPGVKGVALEAKPTFLALAAGNRGRTEWLFRGHIWGQIDILYSQDEGLARNADDARQVFPLERVAASSTERVHLGFRSQVCLDIGESAGEVPCRNYGVEQLFLVADMPCERR